MHFAVAHALLPPGHLDQLLVELRLPLCDALLDLRDLDSPVADLALHVGAQLDGPLTRLHEGLAPDRLRLALGIRDEPASLLVAASESGPARGTQPGGGEDSPHPESDQQRDDREHLHPSGAWFVRGGAAAAHIRHVPTLAGAPAPLLRGSRPARPPAGTPCVPADSRGWWSTPVSRDQRFRNYAFAGKVRIEPAHRSARLSKSAIRASSVSSEKPREAR